MIIETLQKQHIFTYYSMLDQCKTIIDRLGINNFEKFAERVSCEGSNLEGYESVYGIFPSIKMFLETLGNILEIARVIQARGEIDHRDMFLFLRNMQDNIPSFEVLIELWEA